MSLVLNDRVLEVSVSTGTGSMQLGGAPLGFQSFSDGIGAGNTTYYTITDDTEGTWEVGIGTYNAGYLTRDTIFQSSNGDAKVNFGTGDKRVWSDYPASKAVYLDANDKATFAGNSYENFASIAAPTYTEGRLWYDSAQKTLAYYNDVTNNLIHIGQEVQVKVINNTGSTIAIGSPVYITSTSSGQIYPNVALAKADVQATSAVLGLTTQAITTGSVGYVTTVGILQPCNTGTFTVGDVLYLSPYSAGQLMNTVPPTGYAVQVGIVAYSNSPNGSIYVRQAKSYVTAAQIVGTVAIANGGTGATTASGARTNLGLGTIATQDANAVAITGGTIDNTVIGGTTLAAGTFTTITGQTEVLKGTGQNLLRYSSDFSNVAWADPTAGVTATASTLNFTNATSYAYQQVTATVGITYTFSVTISSSNKSTICLRIAGGQTGTAVQTLTSITSTPTRYSVTGVLPAGNTTLLVGFENRVGIGGDGSLGLITVSNAQIEIGSVANTYVATTSAAIYGTPTLSFSGVAGLGLQSDGSLYVSPAGTGALQAQATTSSTVGGNARGANAVDWQTSRGSATQVASAQYSVVVGGTANTGNGFGAIVTGGRQNTSGGGYTFIGGGELNAVSGFDAVGVGGYSNTSAGYFNFIGGGYTNSGTSGSAVTTQSSTMNATTAVTLAASNASIKVGQLITGTSIANYTYVAAISGTSLTLSQAASGSSTSTLSFFTPHGVVVGGGNNQATGSYSFIGGGGDAGTAANRNVASGDWSFVGGGAKNLASGTGAFVGGGGPDGGGNFYANQSTGASSVIVGGVANVSSGLVSFVGGGASHSASGAYSTVGGGNGNYANSNYGSVLGGHFGTSRGIIGNNAIAACDSPITGALGVSQAALLILAIATTDATATVLRSNTAAAGGTNQVILTNNAACYFTGEVISGVTGGGDTKGWTIAGVIKRGANAAATTLVGSTVTSLYADAGAATWTIALAADTTNGGLKVTFTGQASTTIRTVCQIRTTEMTY